MAISHSANAAQPAVRILLPPMVMVVLSSDSRDTWPIKHRLYTKKARRRSPPGSRSTARKTESEILSTLILWFQPQDPPERAECTNHARVTTCARLRCLYEEEASGDGAPLVLLIDVFGVLVKRLGLVRQFVEY